MNATTPLRLKTGSPGHVLVLASLRKAKRQFSILNQTMSANNGRIVPFRLKRAWSKDVGFALKKGNSDEPANDGVPIKERFRAWWNGEALPDRSAARVLDEAAADEVVETESSSEDAEDSDSSWGEARRQLAQEVWSTGFVVPGGSKYVEKLVSGCSLTAAETMLEIGIGMGGGTRTIIGKFGNYVTAYERDAELVAAARRNAVTYDFDDKLDVINKPIEEIELKKNYFRAALLRDVLYTMEDKQTVVEHVSQSLKSGDSFLIITDFLFDADNDSPELAAWKEVEKAPVYPWTEGEIVKCLESFGFTPRIVEDESDDYRAMVVEAWSDYLKSIKGKEVEPAMAKQLEREGEFWARRVAALESGALRYYRIEGVKVS